MGIFDFLKKNKNIENDNGLNEIYHNNGKGEIKLRCYKKNGKVEGVFKSYYENGDLRGEGNLKNGKKDGVWKYYISNESLDGKEKWIELDNEVIFKNGKKVKN